MSNIDFTTAKAAELEAFRASLDISSMNDEQARQLHDLDVLIAKRTAQEETARILQAQKTMTKAKEYDAKAYTMWPELENPETDFAKAVEAQLKEADPDGTNPMALLSIANMIGMDMGMEPAGRRGTETGDPTDKVAGGSGESKPGDGDSTPFLDRTKDSMGKHFVDLIDLGDAEVRDRLEATAEEVKEENIG